MRLTYIYLCFIFWVHTNYAHAQGPPILTEKPIMLGEKKGTIRTLYTFQKNRSYNSHYIMPAVDYNITNQLAVEGGAMLIKYHQVAERKMFLSDLMLAAKYQYFKLDKKGQTIRLAAKGAHTFYISKQHGHQRPTGMTAWGTYGGLVAGWETLKFGLVGELGYVHVVDITPKVNAQFFQLKTALGVPLLTHVFPIKQLNVYAEIEYTDQLQALSHIFYAAPGIQLVYRTIAIEAFWQKSLFSKGNVTFYPKETFGCGLRYIY